MALVEAFKPEVVFVDLVMPDMDGIELGRQLREMLGPAVRTVALNAFGGKTVQEATTAAGFSAHLTKPATAEMLAQALSG